MAMTLGAKRKLMRSASALLLAASVGVLVLSLRTEPIMNVLRSDGSSSPVQGLGVNGAEERTVQPGNDAWKKPLQRPLYDPPPPPPPKVVKKELPPIRTKLLGTIIEPGASRAMISLPGGGVEFRSSGEPLGPQDPEAVIAKINAESISVARGSETTELKIDRGY